MQRQLRITMTAAVAFALVGLTACSKKNEPDSFVKASIEAVGGKPQALWSALPKSYQGDVQGVLTNFGGKMNADLYNDGFVVVGKVVKLLDTQQKFILARPELQGPIDVKDIEKGWAPTVRVLSRITESDIKTLEGVSKLDVEKFLSGPIAQSIQDLTQVAEIAAKSAPMPDKDVGSLLAKLKAAKITIEKSDDKSATVKIEVEGEKPETIEMVKVEDKWIPKELEQAWKPMIAQANAAIAGIQLDAKTVTQVKSFKGMVEPTLDALLAAKTQEEFDGHLNTALEGFGMGAKPELAAAEDGNDPMVVKDTPKKSTKKKSRRSRRRR
jgi:hypothetical protein